MSIELIDKIKPKNNGAFALVDAHDVAMPDGTRLDTWEGGGDIPTFDLVALGLPAIQINGADVELETDTTEMLAALEAGAVRFKANAEYNGIEFNNFVLTVHDISGGYCSYAFDILGTPTILSISIETGKITARGVILAKYDGKEEAEEIPAFDLATLGLPSVPLDGTQVGAQMDTAQITAALDKGPAKFSMVLSIDGEETPFDAVMNPTRATVGEGIVSYMCSHALAIMNGELLNLIFMSGGCYAVILPIGGATASNPATSINLSGLDTTGKIVETYADGSTKTTSLEFDADGNPIKITDGDGNVTTLIW